VSIPVTLAIVPPRLAWGAYRRRVVSHVLRMRAVWGTASRVV